MDPFNEGSERAKFLRSAGKDGEMDEALFKADGKWADGFVRSFDDWGLISLFDANHNRTIDWFEAAEYRRKVRYLVLANHDENRDGRLSGKERESAAKALESGALRYYFSRPCCGGQVVFARGEPAPPSTREVFDRMMQILAGAGFLVNRLGFADRAIEITHGNPIAAIPPGALSRAKPEILARLDREQPIIRVKMAARWTPVFVGEANTIPAQREDEYGTLTIELIYDKAAAYPFFTVLMHQNQAEREESPFSFFGPVTLG